MRDSQSDHTTAESALILRDLLLSNLGEVIRDYWVAITAKDGPCALTLSLLRHLRLFIYGRAKRS